MRRELLNDSRRYEEPDIMLRCSSIKKALDVINASYRWAIDKGVTDTNPVKSVRKRLLKRISNADYSLDNDADVIILSDEEVKRFEEYTASLKTKNKRSYLSALYGRFLIHTGLRCGELFGLKWSDISEDWILSIRRSRVMAKSRGESSETAFESVEKSTKNHKARKIELLPKAIEDLQEIKRIRGEVLPDDLICVTSTGKHNTASNLEHRMSNVYKNSGIETGGGSLHLLRRTFATWLYRKTLDVKLVAAYIGDLESTVMKYYIAAREKVVSVDGTVQQVIRIHGLDDE